MESTTHGSTGPEAPTSSEIPTLTHEQSLRDFLKITKLPHETIEGIVNTIDDPSISNFYFERGDLSKIIPSLTTNPLARVKFKHAIDFIEHMMDGPDPDVSPSRASRLHISTKNPSQLAEIFSSHAYKEYYSLAQEDLMASTEWDSPGKPPQTSPSHPKQPNKGDQHGPPPPATGPNQGAIPPILHRYDPRRPLFPVEKKGLTKKPPGDPEAEEVQVVSL